MTNIRPRKIIRIDNQLHLEPILKMLDFSGYKWSSGISMSSNQMLSSLSKQLSFCKRLYLFIHGDYTVTYSNDYCDCEDYDCEDYDYFTSAEMLDETEHYVYVASELKIEKVIFNEPATIIFWNDGTKTVVKCQEGDEYDKEKGFAMCITKKFFGNKSNFNNVMKEWVK